MRIFHRTLRGKACLTSKNDHWRQVVLSWLVEVGNFYHLLYATHGIKGLLEMLFGPDFLTDAMRLNQRCTSPTEVEFRLVMEKAQKAMEARWRRKRRAANQPEDQPLPQRQRLDDAGPIPPPGAALPAAPAQIDEDFNDDIPIGLRERDLLEEQE